MSKKSKLQAIPMEALLAAHEIAVQAFEQIEPKRLPYLSDLKRVTVLALRAAGRSSFVFELHFEREEGFSFEADDGYLEDSPIAADITFRLEGREPIVEVKTVYHEVAELRRVAPFWSGREYHSKLNVGQRVYVLASEGGGLSIAWKTGQGIVPEVPAVVVSVDERRARADVAVLGDLQNPLGWSAAELEPHSVFDVPFSAMVLRDDEAPIDAIPMRELEDLFYGSRLGDHRETDPEIGPAEPGEAEELSRFMRGELTLKVPGEAAKPASAVDTLSKDAGGCDESL